MFKKDDEKYLIRQLSNNQVILFLGSGFSFDAKNKLNENFPTGWMLGKKIWEFLKYDGDYDDTSLPEMFQALLSKGIKKDYKNEFLENNLLSSEIPEIYNQISKPYWFKIYTTNVDDIISKSFKRNNKSIKELVYPIDQYAERDQSLEQTQIVYLHGKLPCNPDDLIFSPQQYAKAQLTHEPLYGQFVYDYSTLPVIFIGTDLNEPLFERYIVAREGRFGLKERRPKSFIILPSLSQVKADNLRTNYNVHYVKGNTNDFLLWLKSISSSLPEKNEILKKTFPNLLNIAEYAEISGIPLKTITQFARCFQRVPKEYKPIKERSGFLIGTSPRWNDILSNYDIPRTITNDITNKIESHFDKKLTTQKIQVYCITGYAGSGKSTILKRLGITLSQQGRTVFLSYSDYITRKDDIISVLSSINDRVVLMFDNSKNAISQLPNLINAFNTELKYPPIIILATRTNYIDTFDYYINEDIADISKFPIPNLDDDEINNLISKLEDNNLLGILSGMSKHKRIREFKNRANRQILIAMKEATNGRSFNDIIKDEFQSLQPKEVKNLSICLALNTELGFTNSKQDLVGFSESPKIEVLNYFETILQGTILNVGNNGRFMLRHKILADYFIKHCTTTEMLKDAYIRVLSVLAPELINRKGPSRIFNLYKALINHKVLYRRFKGEIEMARDVYESISVYFKTDAHFWLQYGSLEVEGKGGDLLLAQNYISQAESLAPKSSYVQTAKCNLFYKQAKSASSIDEAKEYKIQADELAQSLLLKFGKEEQIIFHIYCGGRYNYTSKWIKDRNEKKTELLELKSTIKTGLSYHPFSKKLKLISDAIERAYLHLGIQDSLDDPQLPNYVD